LPADAPPRLGAGASGFAALGIARQQPATAIREEVSLIRRLWAGETVTQAGRVVQFHGGHLDFRARPNIPILVAGRGPRILELAGEVADGVIIGTLLSPSTFDYAQRHLRAGAARGGRRLDRFETVVWAHTALDAEPARARDAVRQIVVGVLLTSRAVLGDLGVTLPDAFPRSWGRLRPGRRSRGSRRSSPRRRPLQPGRDGLRPRRGAPGQRPGATHQPWCRGCPRADARGVRRQLYPQVIICAGAEQDGRALGGRSA
jgi:alkanesulfonate monooxygenase SsuD/methylene tetrahydromethanopterin reductase-like flavin-dependent oxidoreductase (luciferase family)